MEILMVKMSPIESIDSATLRTIALTKGLIEMGHSVDYITIPPSRFHNTRKLDEILSKINIIRTSKNELYHSIIKERNSNKLNEMFLKYSRLIYHSLSLHDNSYTIAKNLKIDILRKKEYDLIISSSDPKTSHIAVLKLINQGLKYKKWIQYWGDPLANDITKKVIYPAKILAIYERKILRYADKIVYVSPLTLKEQKALFPSLKHKMDFAPVPYLKEKIYPKSENRNYKIGYFGDYYSSFRNIKPLYNACSEMSNVNLTIMGDSDLNLADRSNIEVLPRGDSETNESNTDLLVCVLNSKGAQIPGKIYHYAATNKAIMVILDGDYKAELRSYLESFNRYILCENEEEDIVQTLNRIMDSKDEFYPSPFFSPQNIAKELLKDD